MDILTNIVQWLSGKLKEFDGRGNVRNYIGKKIYLYAMVKKD